MRTKPTRLHQIKQGIISMQKKKGHDCKKTNDDFPRNQTDALENRSSLHSPSRKHRLVSHPITALSTCQTTRIWRLVLIHNWPPLFLFFPHFNFFPQTPMFASSKNRKEKWKFHHTPLSNFCPTSKRFFNQTVHFCHTCGHLHLLSDLCMSFPGKGRK
jgi:hypothetical protein